MNFKYANFNQAHREVLKQSLLENVYGHAYR